MTSGCFFVFADHEVGWWYRVSEFPSVRQSVPPSGKVYENLACKRKKLGFHGIQANYKDRMIWIVACRCILATSKSDSILVSIGLIVDLLRAKKNENAWKEWPEIWNVNVCWTPPEMIKFWSVMALYWLSVGKRLVVFPAFRVEHKEWPEVWHASVSWPYSRVFLFWPNSGPLVRKGLIKWGLLAF